MREVDEILDDLMKVINDPNFNKVKGDAMDRQVAIVTKICNEANAALEEERRNKQ